MSEALTTAPQNSTLADVLEWSAYASEGLWYLASTIRRSAEKEEIDYSNACIVYALASELRTKIALAQELMRAST